MIELERSRREHDLALAKFQADSQASVKSVMEASQKIQDEIKELTKETKSFTTTWTYFAFALAFLVLVVAVIGVILGR